MCIIVCKIPDKMNNAISKTTKNCIEYKTRTALSKHSYKEQKSYRLTLLI